MNIISSFSGIFWNKEQHRPRMFWRLAIYVSLLTILIILAEIIFGDSNVLSSNLSLSIAVLLVVLATTVMVGKWIDRRRIEDFGFIPSLAWWKEFLFGFGLGALLMGMVFLFGLITGSITLQGYFSGASLERGFIFEFLRALIFCIFVGIYEEILVRGYIFVNLAEGLKMNRIDNKRVLLLAFFISSLIFGLMHILNPGTSWISTLNISIAGIFLGLGMVLTGRLGLSIGLHISWNLFQGNVFGFPVSGVNFGATLIETNLTGPEWFTGGGFGPEAGVIGLAAMLIGSILILFWMRKRDMLEINELLVEYNTVDIDS